MQSLECAITGSLDLSLTKFWGNLSAAFQLVFPNASESAHLDWASDALALSARLAARLAALCTILATCMTSHQTCRAFSNHEYMSKHWDPMPCSAVHPAIQQEMILFWMSVLCMLPCESSKFLLRHRPFACTPSIPNSPILRHVCGQNRGRLSVLCTCEYAVNADRIMYNCQQMLWVSPHRPIWHVCLQVP